MLHSMARLAALRRSVIRMRTQSLAVLATLALTSFSAIAATPAKPTAKAAPAKEISKTITVHEGTDMSLAVSPDKQTVLVDLQGMIYSMPISGGTMKRLTSEVDEMSQPAFSPDGQWVAMQSYKGGTFHIWVMHPDGTGLKQVTTGHGDDREPQFSPDGKTIAFSSDRAFTGSYDIWTVDVATGSVKQLTMGDEEEYEPTWSPDGKTIAYISAPFVAGAGGRYAAKSTDIFTIPVNGGKPKKMMDDKAGKLEAPSWGPGNKLAAVQFAGAGMMGASSAYMTVDGKRISTAFDDTFPFRAAWISPTELLYTANGQIVHADLAAKSEKKIPFEAGIAAHKPIYTAKKFNFDETMPHTVKGIFAPALSPDGKSIAFVALNQLYVMPIGGKPKALTSDQFYKQGPMWSPDGKQLAYVTDKGGTQNVYIMDAATGSDRPLKADAEHAQIFPAWSPDGKWIAHQNEHGGTFITDVATGKTEPLAPETFFPGRAAFSPNGKTVLIATVHPYTHRFREGVSDMLAVDVATKKTEWFKPAPFESISTRTEDGPIYSPKGNEVAFVMDDQLYVMPVDSMGKPSGKATLLSAEITDAPTWSGDGSKILYLSGGKLRLINRATKAITPVALPLTWKQDKPTGTTVIHAGKVWTGKDSAVLEDQDVVITANRIVSITPHGKMKSPAGAKTVEAPNSTLLPGLWENHVHPNSDNGIYYGDRGGRLWLIYGVTELRDMADQAYRAIMQRETYNSNATPGPRLFATGEAVDGERTYYPMMIPTLSEEQLHRQFARAKALDYDFLKLYVRLPYSWIVEGQKFAHTQMGVQTAGHYLLPEVALGNDGMSHVSATARTGWAYSRSQTGFSYEDVRKMIEESGSWVTSTLLSPTVMADMPQLADDPRYNVAPPWEQARLKASRDMAVKTGAANSDRIMREEATVRAVVENKGMIIGGTDSPLDTPATSLMLNLIEQVKYGLKPWQALQTVTSGAAIAARIPDLGTIEKGKLADLILVDGNPLTEIKDITKVSCVVKNGRVMSVSEIAAPFAKLDTGKDICPSH